jgi:hypothetical protein
VAQECVADAGGRDVGRLERGMRLLPLLLPAEQAALRGVRQRQMDTVPVRAEAGKEAIGIGRCAVRGAPQGEPLDQGERGEPRLAEDRHVRRPVDQRVRALRGQPVVVARGQDDAPIRPGEARLQEGDRVRRDAVVLEQVAGGEDRVHPLLLCQRQDAAQRLAPVGATPAGRFRASPGERSVEVEVGKKQELHCPEG